MLKQAIYSSLAVLAGLALTATAWGQNCDCTQGCCPPWIKYKFEGAPRLKFKHGCPKPICDPCQLPHFGYYGTCWQPWPFPPEWSHCPVPPPAALVEPVVPKRFQTLPIEDPKPKEAPPPRPLSGMEETSRPPQLSMPAEQIPAHTEPMPMPRKTQQGTTPYSPTPADRVQPAPFPPLETRPDGPQLSPMTKRNFEPELPQTVVPASVPPAAAPVEAQRPKAINTGGGPAMRMVNSRRILLDYDLADVPASDKAMLELWYTQDGRNWIKDQTSVKSGSPYVVEVNKEGTYGFMMIARQAGEKSTPPTPGETPQVWVEVDWTRPHVQLIDARTTISPSGRTLGFTWMVNDNNLGRSPVTLSWAETPNGPWNAFAAGLENTGRYQWQVPNNVPKQIFVKMEAFDLVGNVGQAQTPMPIMLP